MSERLHKLLAQHGIGSRRQVEAWIREGRVLVNGRPAEIGHALQEGERVIVDGKDVTRLASMAKLKCGRVSREVTDSCLQYWGGMGFTWDNPLSQAYRDSRLVSIGGGADEVMLGIICKLEGTLPGKQG